MTAGLFIEILVKSSILIVLGFALRRRINKENPALRHLVLLVTLIGCIAIPFAVPLIKYQTKIPVPQQFDLGNTPLTASQASTNQFPASTITSSSKLVEGPSWQEIAFAVWFAGFAFVAVRYSLGLVSLARLRQRQSEPTFADRFKGANFPTHELRISTKPSPKTAMTWGVFRPTILLPMDSATWTSHRMEMILLHELAHVRRKDFVSQVLTEIACAIYWFNPLVWQSAHAMREDAELAADDAVIQSGIRPTDYATELLQLAANLSKGNLMLNRVGISTMTNSKIESRLTAILSSTACSSTRRARGITLVSVLGALALSGLAVTTVASLKLHQDATPGQLKSEAMSRLKQLALATQLYANDYDYRLPNVASNKDAKRVIAPYLRNQDILKSPRLGAEFTFNLNMSGVDIRTLRSPAEDVVWFEATPKGLAPHAAYVDGHVNTITELNLRAFQKALQQKYHRGGATAPSNGVGD